jgi:hypothetical protein
MKTLKYEEVLRNEYRDLAHARAAIREFLEKIYNQKRLHSALGLLTKLYGGFKHDVRITVGEIQTNIDPNTDQRLCRRGGHVRFHSSRVSRNSRCRLEFLGAGPQLCAHAFDERNCILIQLEDFVRGLLHREGGEILMR